MKPIAVLVALLVLALPAAASAALPSPIGEPSGVYTTNKVTLTGFKLHRCARCRARIELTEDGLEMRTVTSYVKFRGSACNNADPSYIEAVRLSSGGSYRTHREEGRDRHIVRGRVTSRVVTGHGSITCHPSNHRKPVHAKFSFRAKLTGHRTPPPGATVRCESVGVPSDAAMFLPFQRNLGCGLARDVARALRVGAPCGTSCSFEGMTCANVPFGQLDRAATFDCGTADGAAEVITLNNCPAPDLQTRTSAIYVQRTATVTCSDAVALAHVNGLCEDGQTSGCTQPPGWQCTSLDPATVDRFASEAERCTGVADARRVVLLGGYTTANG